MIKVIRPIVVAKKIRNEAFCNAVVLLGKKKKKNEKEKKKKTKTDGRNEEDEKGREQERAI